MMLLYSAASTVSTAGNFGSENVISREIFFRVALVEIVEIRNFC